MEYEEEDVHEFVLTTRAGLHEVLSFVEDRMPEWMLGTTTVRHREDSGTWEVATRPDRWWRRRARLYGRPATFVYNSGRPTETAVVVTVWRNLRGVVAAKETICVSESGFGLRNIRYHCRWFALPRSRCCGVQAAPSPGFRRDAAAVATRFSCMDWGMTARTERMCLMAGCLALQAVGDGTVTSGECVQRV